MTDRCHCPNEHWQDYPEGGTCGVCGKQTGASMMIPVTTRLSDYPAIGPGVQVSNQVVGIATGYTLIADAELSALREDLKCARWALQAAINWARDTFDAWDDDQEARVGKRLKALYGGLPGYTPITDFIVSEASKCDLEMINAIAAARGAK